MWLQFILFTTVNVALGSNYGWKSNTEYTYTVKGRTLTGLHEVADQYSGIFMKATLSIHSESDDKLMAKISNAQYAQIHQQMLNGWRTEIPESELNYQNLPISDKPFQINLNKGVVSNIIVSKEIENWEANLIKSIVSQIKLDLNGIHAIEGQDDELPEEGNPSAVYKTMEDTITGKYETSYEINILPEIVLQAQEWIVPKPELKGDGKFIQIIKNRNFDNREGDVGYHFGFGSNGEWDFGDGRLGNFFVRAAGSRTIISGNLKDYTIQSSCSNNEIILKPTLNSKQNGMVASEIKIILTNIQPASGTFEEVQQPRNLENLVYNTESTPDEKLVQQSPISSIYKIFKNKIKAVETIANQIGQNMHLEQTLSKFTLLIELIRSIDEKEIQEATRLLYDKKKVWKVFRDAVAGCGTLPALLNIKQWIESKKITIDEALQLFSVMSTSVRNANEEYIRSFYALVRSKEIESQTMYKDDAMQSFTWLIGNSINKKYYRNQFTFESNSDNFVTEELIPYLKKELTNAVEANDSQQILIHIRALGNVAHQHILAVFEPYLEGAIKVSQFQRLQMMLAMDRITYDLPDVARPVLYKIYQNVGENWKVRIAAIYFLMKTEPPTSMMNRLAQFTNFDIDQQVNAAVKSIIKSAAQLEDIKFANLSATARSAIPLLTKTTYGQHYSHADLRSYVLKETNLIYDSSVYVLGSTDNIIPNAAKYFLSNEYGGVRRRLVYAQAVVTSVNELINVFEKQTENHKQKQKYQYQWSSEAIAKMLNIKLDRNMQLEGSLFLQLEDFYHFFPYNNATINMLPQVISGLELLLQHGTNIDYTKFLNRQSLQITFPTEMSFPFVYTLDVPTMISIEGKITAKATPNISSNKKIHKPNTINANSEITAILSTQTQTKLGFITTFDNQIYTSGYNKNFQINLPIKSEIRLDLEHKQLNVIIQPRYPNKNIKIFDYRSVPYTRKDDIFNFELKKADCKELVSENPIQYKNVFGNSMNVQYESQREFSDTNWFYNNNLDNTKMSIEYIPNKSSSNKIEIKMGYEHKFDGKESNVDISNFSKLSKETQTRQHEFAKMASFSNSEISVYDVSLKFLGAKNVEYVVTSAYASNPINDQNRFLFYFKKYATKPYQISMLSNSKISSTKCLDYTHILDSTPITTTNLDFSYGPNYESSTNLHLKATFERSDSRKKYLQTLYRAEECKREMEEDNHQLSACADMTAEANLMDAARIEIKLQNMTLKSTNLLQKIYNEIRHFGFNNLEEKIFNTNSKVDYYNIVANLEPNFKTFNFSINSEHKISKFVKVGISDWTKQYILTNSIFQPTLGNDAYKPYCIVDQTAVNTFDNKTYPISIEQEWVVMFQSENHNILVRNAKDSKREIKITISSSKTIEIDLKPVKSKDFSETNPRGNIYINRKQYKLNDKTTDVKIDVLHDGELRLDLDICSIIYDGVRIKLITNSYKFRGSARGLCGNFNGEISDDFLTPNNCMLTNPSEFVATYTIGHVNTNQSYCYRNDIIYANVISNQNAGRSITPSEREIFDVTVPVTDATEP